MKIIDRYIMAEMAAPFFFGVCTFTLLFFSAETLMGVAKMILESNAGFMAVLEYLYSRLPYVLTMTFPMSILLASLMAYGRLSGDSEITAMKAGGIGFFRIFVPGLVFCMLISVCSWLIGDFWAPSGMKRAYDMLIELKADDQIERALITTPRILSNGEEQMVYAHSLNVKEQSMRGVFVHYFWQNRRVREIYTDEARWNGEVWEVKNIRVTDFDRDKGDVRYEAKSAQVWTALSKDESPQSPEQLAKRKMRPEEMSRAELNEYLATLPPADQSDPEAFKKQNKYRVQYHQKLSLPVTCLIFGAFAIPLAIRPQRTSTSIGLGLSLLFILLYYVLMTVGMILGESGKTSAWFAAWLPNIVFCVVGIYFVRRASQK